jgi:cell wall-associated NlpC family hydrolase
MQHRASAVDRQPMVQTRFLRLGFRATATAALLACCVVVPAHAAVTLSNWDPASQGQVIRAGLMGNVGRSFDGAAPLSASQANAVMTALAVSRRGGAGSPTALVDHIRQNPVTVTTFDGVLEDQLGLKGVAAHVQAAAVAAGLRPPSYFGSEVVARFLGLRYNHPSGTDQLELFPSDPITRAEAAWSLAQVLRFGDWNVSQAQQTLSGFVLPRMTANQLQVLRIAVSRIGYPYVYAGTTDDTSDGLAHGGFDCSGFVWRVYKVSGLAWGRQISGRTAAQMAGEIPRGRRLPRSRLQPGDLLFFGSANFSSAATEQNITHTGIYLGDNWAIHSSSQGVYVLALRGSWLGDEFAWGRRVVG